MRESKETLVALAIKYEGNWDKMYKDLTTNNFPEDEYYDMIYSLKSNYVTIIDLEYPQQLKAVHKPPLVLFYYGDINLIRNYRNNISVVGSRAFSEYGSRITQELVSGLAKMNYSIISGMAIGIDSIAHYSAINSGGKTVAVLGSGIDFCYPQSNIELYEIIKAGHLVISEYPGQKPPTPECFPIRNRIIAGLSKTLLVTEAGYHSGSLVTAMLALRGNCDVMCVPYNVGSGSECNRLIKNGAFLIESVDDVLEQMSAF